MIDLTMNEKVLENAITRARERDIIIPTFEEQKRPKKLVPQKYQDELKNIGLWDVTSRNLYRITWKNQPVEKGGGFQEVANYIELPQGLKRQGAYLS